MSELGSTGEYPRGKLNEFDEGGLRLAVMTDPKTNTIIMDFGKPTRWIGMAPEDAVRLAMTLIDSAKKVSEQSSNLG